MDFASKLASRANVQAAVSGSPVPAAPINPPMPQQFQQPPQPAAPAYAAQPPQAQPMGQPQPQMQTIAMPGVQAQPQAAPAGTRPPWANPACGACGQSPHPGFNTEGNPCRICDVAAQRVSGLQSGHFDITVGNGMIYWQPKAGVGAPAGSCPAPSGQGPVAAEDRTAPAPAAAAAPAKKGRGRPKKPAAGQPAGAAAPEAEGGEREGFVLCTNCLPLRVEGEVSLLSEVVDKFLTAYAAHMAQTGATGTPPISHWTDIDFFHRKDAMQKHAESIVSQLGDYVIASPIGSAQCDLRAMYDAIRPYASVEIVGTSA